MFEVQRQLFERDKPRDTKLIMPGSDQCAINADGNLKDASEIDWFNDPDDKTPIASGSGQTGRGHRTRDTRRMEDIIEAERDSGLEDRPKKPKRKRKAKSKGNDDTDQDDGDYSGSSDDESSSESEGENSDVVEISNEELADSLPAKTVPLGSRRAKGKSAKTKGKRPAKKVRTSPEPEVPKPSSAKKKGLSGNKRSPIYYFYEQVVCDEHGDKGIKGDKFYKCWHGSRKTFKITKKMNSSLNGLVGHLKTNFPPMFKLYQVLNAQNSEPTNDEILLASGQKVLDPATLKTYIAKFKEQSAGIQEAFARQRAKAMVPWDQIKFERLMTEWMIACDQPFDEVEKPEFIAMMEYGRDPEDFFLPQREAMRRQVMQLGNETIEEMKTMFASLPSKVSLSLDAWTSSNYYAFLAIVAHYVTEDGECEELLIDFRELIGAHSGENMADVVWSTMKLYGLEDKIMAIMMDNASNNDTLMTAIEDQCFSAGIRFSATDARVRCMPHTIHLAAVKLLQGIGVLSKSSAKTATAAGFNYQDDVNAGLDREDDIEAAPEDEEPSDKTTANKTTEPTEKIQSAVLKLRKIVRHIRSSPQRRQSWFREVERMNANITPVEDRKPALMLILDVKTRWSSTHQMLRRAYDYRPAIDYYVRLEDDLRASLLSPEEWHAINLVATWLKSFRSATTQMSTMSTPMLSTTHAIFRGLQEEISETLRLLPDKTSPNLIKGLTDAHRKLSDYYYTFDASPYYLWSSLLDPRISYSALKDEFKNNSGLLDDLERSKSKLQTYFKNNYLPSANMLSPANSTDSITSVLSASSHSGPRLNSRSPQKNFMSRFQRRARAPSDELQEFWNLPQEDFETCDPLKWWLGRRSQFPNLYRLSCDIFSIPGSAVAVERIFSGGRDTISLRRASLKPKTIRILMIVKRKLVLAREKIKKKIRAY